MAELVATMAIRPLVSMLKDKASSYLLEQYKVMEGMEEQHKILKRKLPAILDVITDAEEQAAAHREGAKAWLEELKKVAYEANEVFDEFKYEALRREAKKNGHYSKLGVDGIKLFPTHNRVVFRYRMGEKLCRILLAMEVLIAEMHAFRFKYRPQPPMSKQWRETDHLIVDPEEIASRSRGQDKKNIVDMLLGQPSNADLAVVPIVGMGGLGKTTLAQLVYNDSDVQKHFQLLVWVCVSDSFDVNSLAKSIIEAAPKMRDDENTRDEPLLDRLKKLVSGQRYLLVLDDVWNREVGKWGKLKAILQHGGTGSAVLTTTRDKRVADIMGSDRAYDLKSLEDGFLKEIIEATAFGSEKEKYSELVDMVDEIVKRCHGSPLAATALGCVLRTKRSLEEWKAISSISNICTEEYGILPILKLSYNNLPSHMKQCFAFCAVFPKDYLIDVDKLIQLWIANGFLQEHKGVRLETTGRQVFNELAMRSFFQDVKQVSDNKTTCTIHDLMHDVALSTMEKECVAVTEELSQSYCLPDTTRHLFISSTKSDTILNDSLKKKSPTIQTLLSDRDMGSLNYFSKHSSLQVLQLRLRSFSLPLKAKYLHHLRYLDLSESSITALPEDISILYNLQMLDLSDCHFLGRLPQQMKYMSSLRYLSTHGCPKLKSMPPELGKLTLLQTLTCFVAGTGPDCSDVTELYNLNLGGQLELCQLENVIEADATVANLGNKKDLRGLTLRWTYVLDNEVLDSFKPHDGLQVVRIYSYGGKRVGMLQNMVEIHLFRCEKLQCLFSCGTSFTFPRLKKLKLEELPDFERWWEINKWQGQEIIFPQLEKLLIKCCRKLTALPETQLLREPCVDGNTVAGSTFPALKVLKLIELNSFQRWEAAEGTQGKNIMFPQLEKLFIQYCPELIALPKAPFLETSCGGNEVTGRSTFPELKILELDCLKSFSSWGVMEGTYGEQLTFPNLESVHIMDCPELTTLPEAPKLIVLQVERGNQQVSVWIARYMTSLINLKLQLKETETNENSSIELVDSMEKCDKSPLTALNLFHCNIFFHPGALVLWTCFVQLQDLEICSCDALVHWPDFQRLVSLNRLKIVQCNNLIGYAEVNPEPLIERRQHLPHLEYLEIKECASLVELFNVATSLKEMDIEECPKLESIFGKSTDVMASTVVSDFSSSVGIHFLPFLKSLRINRCPALVEILNLPPSVKDIKIGYCSNIQVISFQLDRIQTSVAEPSAAPKENFHPPCLKHLEVNWCNRLTELLNIPLSLKKLLISGCCNLQSISGHLDALKRLEIDSCCSLKSLVSQSGGLPSLKYLDLVDCESLASLPNGPRAYSSLECLTVEECPALKILPRCLQQKLGSLECKDLDAHHECKQQFFSLRNFSNEVKEPCIVFTLLKHPCLLF